MLLLLILLLLLFLMPQLLPLLSLWLIWMKISDLKDGRSKRKPNKQIFCLDEFHGKRSRPLKIQTVGLPLRFFKKSLGIILEYTIFRYLSSIQNCIKFLAKWKGFSGSGSRNASTQRAKRHDKLMKIQGIQYSWNTK